MEAGINPVPAPVAHTAGLKLQQYGSMINELCLIAAQSLYKVEHNIICHLLTTLTNHTNTTLYQYSTSLHNNSKQYLDPPTEVCIYLQDLHNHFWHLLKNQYTIHIRSSILQFLISSQKFTESFHYILNNPNQHAISNTFHSPPKTSKPSYFDQVTSRTSKTIDPYLLALTKNFYYPISTEIMTEEMEDDTASCPEPTTNTPSQSPKKPSPKIVTVEDSIETITDIISEMEDDDPPVQTTPTQSEAIAIQQAIQTKASSYTHRFSIYKRNGIPTSNLKPSSQLSLFQSFCKCLKSIDTQLQILPIRNDHNIHPITTSAAQITHMDEIGITNFFKAYKRTKRTLSGDFHIGTSIPFDELKNHKNLSTWFHLNGYNITISGCQSSDMVRIGFLSRVRGFTYRDDMHDFIKNTEQWKQHPFHFRLYFDIFSSGTKGQNTYVLMIDVDRPNIDQAISYFQQNYDGEKFNSPNKIPYLFFPLYRKTYNDTERTSIIRDNEHYTEKDSVVGILGLNPLNTVVQMVQGIHITIRHLLLAIPCQGTSNGKLFHQIERQANNEWQLCCFHTMDTTKVSLKLANLETLIKRYIHPNDHHLLFSDPTTPLRFSGQAAPIKKGRPKIPILEVPEATMQYTSKAFTKLFSPPPKRPAIPHIIEHSVIADIPAVTTNSPSISADNNKSISTPSNSTNTEINNKIQNVEMDIKNQNNRLARLEDICSQLATSTQHLSTQLVQMNQNVNEKLGEMADSINQLHQSPSYRTSKHQKSHHGNGETVFSQS
jgi:hypothetical protein